MRPTSTALTVHHRVWTIVTFACRFSSSAIYKLLATKKKVVRLGLVNGVFIMHDKAALNADLFAGHGNFLILFSKTNVI